MTEILVDSHKLASIYSQAHSLMRNIDGLQPQEAFDELLKYLFFKQINEKCGPDLSVSYRLSAEGLFSEDYEVLAEEVRGLFSEYLNSASWSSTLWSDKRFHLSDDALFALHQLFRDVTFGQIPFDVRGQAIKEFLPAGIRKGLGIYLTPDDVVRMMVEFVDAASDSKVYDPACGSGTFLIETIKRWRESGLTGHAVWGTDKNPRMLLLSELNLGHLAGTDFKRQVEDALFSGTAETFIQPNSFDVILTNPPFGVVLESQSHDLNKFQTCRDANGNSYKRQHSEIVFIEQSLRLLRPGGTLAAVLPKSVLTNLGFSQARATLDTLGYIYALVTLPPETFQMTGTQAQTVVLFVRKYDLDENREETIRISLAEVKNVGYDSTGRARKENQLPMVAAGLNKSLAESSDAGICRVLPSTLRRTTFSKVSELISSAKRGDLKKTLRDVVEFARTGKTPARASYNENGEGIFVVKVGNLTGKGINWLPRDRNFINPDNVKSRKGGSNLTLQKGDILLTSSAHSSAYIAKKADIVTTIPSWLGETASFVGEVMMIRPRQDIVDSFSLLAYLRLPETIEEIQRKVRGQTAHLHSDDLLNLPIPDAVLSPSENMRRLAASLKKEAQLNDELNALVHDQNLLMNDLQEL